jgi:hypothetical protein
MPGHAPETRLTATRRATVTSTSFFFGAHLALLFAVFVGFARTFYLRPLFSTHPLPVVLYVHGAVLTLWFLLTALQGWLVHTRRVRLHRRLGYAVACYAAVVIVMGLVAIARLSSEIDSAADPENIVVWGNLFTLVLFATFIVLALVFRKQPEAHKRLTLLASVSIVGPALARFTEWRIFPGGFDARPAYGIGGLLLLFGSLIAYDLVTRRRPHPASWMGAVAIVASLAVAVFLGISGEGFRILHAA